MEEEDEEGTAGPDRAEPPGLGISMLKECSLNKQDGLRQYSLTPHPSALPQGFLDQQRAESAALLNKSIKSKIIRFVGIEIRLPDGTPYSFTPNKSIIKPPIVDTAMMDMLHRAAWQVSLSPSDPIREKGLPAEGIVLLKLKSDVYGGQYDLEDLVQQQGPLGGGYFLVPLYSSAGSGEGMHPIFNHVQIVVNTGGGREEGFRVAKVSLVYIPTAELGDASEDTFDELSSPPITFPITIASFMDTASATHKRKQPDPTLLESAPTAERKEEEEEDDEEEEEEESTGPSPVPTTKRRRSQADEEGNGTIVARWLVGERL